MWFLFAAHVDNEMYLSRSLDRLGDSALNKDQEPDIAAAFLKFAVVTKELSALMKTLVSRMRLKCDGTRAETRFHPSAKRASPFKSAGGVSSVEYWQASCAHQPAGFVLLVQVCVL
jgi:hypothetical protein